MAVSSVVGEPSLDSILQARALSREKLEVVCPIEVCNQLALKLTSWKELCPFIGLSEQDETDIEVDYRKHKERKIDDRPTAHQLIRVEGKSGKEIVIRDVLASQWEELLLELGPSSETYMIKNIDRTCRGDVQEACREVLLKWLSGELPSNLEPISWRTLVQAIKKLDFEFLATELEQELLP